ncbi:MAG TPA: NAD(+)/NADH kinase [Myxococcota bacterium]|nr:NAD(+)/NADH kinase [Myxococcota bacterium]
MIVADPRNPQARHHLELLRAHLAEGDEGDATVVIGGDGFMLHTIEELGLDRTYLGLNAGRIGFLLNDVHDWAAAAAALRQRSYRVWRFPVLEARIVRSDGTVCVEQAVNDVVLERSTGQTAHLRLVIDGTEVVGTLTCDGLIFSTALGSTAYTFSAGGPACHPTLPVFAVTAICPHTPRLAPFLLPTTATARVEVRASERRPVRAVTDGRRVDDVVAVDLWSSASQVQVAWFDGHDFTACMVAKILRA